MHAHWCSPEATSHPSHNGNAKEPDWRPSRHELTPRTYATNLPPTRHEPSHHQEEKSKEKLRNNKATRSCRDRAALSHRQALAVLTGRTRTDKARDLMVYGLSSTLWSTTSDVVDVVDLNVDQHQMPQGVHDQMRKTQRLRSPCVLRI